jgi:hypothetical protein
MDFAAVSPVLHYLNPLNGYDALVNGVRKFYETGENYTGQIARKWVEIKNEETLLNIVKTGPDLVGPYEKTLSNLKRELADLQAADIEKRDLIAFYVTTVGTLAVSYSLYKAVQSVRSCHNGQCSTKTLAERRIDACNWTAASLTAGLISAILVQGIKPVAV